LEDIFISFCRKLENTYVVLRQPNLDYLPVFSALATSWTFLMVYETEKF